MPDRRGTPRKWCPSCVFQCGECTSSTSGFGSPAAISAISLFMISVVPERKISTFTPGLRREKAAVVSDASLSGCEV